MRFVPWVLQTYSSIPPEIFEWLTFLRDAWHRIEGPVILIGMFWVIRRLRSERVKLSERVDTLALLVRAARDEAEAAIVQPTPAAPSRTERPIQTPSTNNWEAIRVAWRDIRDRLELKIEELPQRRRGKYSRIRRTSYRPVIHALEQDDALNPSVADKLRNMDRTFNTLKFRPTDIADEDVWEFQRGIEFVDPWLPDLADPDPAPTPEPPAAPAKLPVSAPAA
jgi:hypothetical protein